MAAYTVNTTVAQETLLDNVLPFVNARRAANGQGPMTKAQLVQRLFVEGLGDAQEELRIAVALNRATPEQRTMMRRVLRLPEAG